MPVQPRYNAKLEIGEPVLKGFWTNFLNTRAAINQQIMEESGGTPAERDRALRNLYDRLADLHEEERKASSGISESETKSAKMDRDLAIQFLRSGASIDVASINARGRLESTRLDNAADLMIHLDSASEEKRSSFKDGRAVGEQVRGVVTTKEDLMGQLNHRAGGDRAKQLGILAELEQRGLANDEIRRTIEQYTPGREAGESIEAYAKRTQFIFEPEEAEQFAKEVTTDYHAGGNSVGQMTKLMVAMGADPKAAMDLANEVSFGIGGSSSARGSVTPGRGKGDLEDTLANNRALQAQIMARIKKLESQESRPGSRFGAFYKNAVTETLLRTPSEDDRLRLEGLSMFSDDEASEIAAALKEAGGDVDKAAEILRRGPVKMVKPGADEKPKAAEPEAKAAEKPRAAAAATPGPATTKPASTGQKTGGTGKVAPKTPAPEGLPVTGTGITTDDMFSSRLQAVERISDMKTRADAEPDQQKKKALMEQVDLAAEAAGITAPYQFAWEEEVTNRPATTGTNQAGWEGIQEPPVAPGFVPDPDEALLSANTAPNPARDLLSMQQKTFFSLQKAWQAEKDPVERDRLGKRMKAVTEAMNETQAVADTLIRTP